MVEDDLMQLPKAAVIVKVKAKAKKIKVKKLKCSDLHKMQEFWIKKFSPYKSVVDLGSEPTAGNKNTHHVPKMV